MSNNKAIKMNNLNAKEERKNEYNDLLKEDYSDISEEQSKNSIQINLEEKALLNKNFVLTEEARERIAKCYSFFKEKKPILLEGPTGTSKTLTAEIACQVIFGENKLLQFNLSSETESSDLLGKLVDDPNSPGGFSFKEGPFLDAFKNGKPILLEGINLSTKAVIKLIEEALDNEMMPIEIPGVPFKRVEKSKDFALIAISKPKGHPLSPSFLSRFRVIEFTPFQKSELTCIALGLSENFGFHGEKKVIEDLVKFHSEWSEISKFKEEPYSFTAREIASAVKAFSKTENFFDVIMNIYGARYSKKEKTVMKEVLNKYESLRGKEEYFKKPENFPRECYWNESIEQAVKSIVFSVTSNHNIIITGAEGCGKTQLAKWIAKLYDKNDCSDDPLIAICSKELQTCELIGKQKPNTEDDSKEGMMKWEEGILTEGMKKGRIVILDQIEEASASVMETIKNVLDNIEKKKKVDIPENPKAPEILVHEDFRLICVCDDISKIELISPGFTNRFDVVALEEQISSLENNSLKELIGIIFKNIFGNLNRIKEKNNKNEARADSSTEEEEVKNPEEKESTDEDGEKSKDSEGSSNRKENEPNETTNDNRTTHYDSNDSSSEEQQYIDPVIIKSICNKGKSLTIYQLSRLCYAVHKYSTFFKAEPKITNEDIVNFAFDILSKNPELRVPKIIKNFLLKDLLEKAGDNSKYFYKDSLKLMDFMAMLYASSLIGLHLCIIGPSGSGKTSCVSEFARMRGEVSGAPCFMSSFSPTTNPTHLYGVTTIKDGKFSFLNGGLVNAMIEGGTFIADDFNFSCERTINALAPSLEPSFGEKMLIPGVDEKIFINPSFFFISCRDSSNLCRKHSSTMKRLKEINFPEQDIEDVRNICVNIKKAYPETNEKITDQEAVCLANFMFKLNSSSIKNIKPWTLLEITRIFQRIRHQNKCPKNFYNLKIYHNVLFYVLSGIPKEEIDESIDEVVKLIVEIFGLSGDYTGTLKRCYGDTPKPKKIGATVYMMKGECGINLNLFYPKTIFRQSASLDNSFFKVLLSSENESILLAGPSCYKEFLSRNILGSPKVIWLNQGASVEELLGYSDFLRKREEKDFYLTQFCEILNISKAEFFKKLKEDTLTLDELKEKYSSQSNNIPASVKVIAKSLAEKIFAKEEISSPLLEGLVPVFKPGLLLSGILSGNSLVLKNLQNYPSLIRFKELFSGNKKLTLDEDVYGFFTPKAKELSTDDSSFRIIATCGADEISKVPRSILPYFTVIYVDDYKEEERIFILNKYVNDRKLTHITQEHIEYMIKFAGKYNKEFKKGFSFSQMMSMLQACNRMTERLKDDDASPKPPLLYLKYTLFIFAKGLLHPNLEEDTLYSFRSMLDEDFCSSFPEIIYESPIDVENKGDSFNLVSKISGLSIKCSPSNKPKKKIVYTEAFNQIIEVLHFGISLNIPIILESPSGQGKQTAIKVISESIGYKIVNIKIAKSTKPQEIVKQINNARKKYSGNDKMIVVFHNINNASVGAFDVISSIFSDYNKSLSLLNSQEKGMIYPVAIFNSEFEGTGRLPNSFIGSSIYHIVKENSVYTMEKVLKNLIDQVELNTHLFLKHLDKNQRNNIPNTLNDIEKFIRLREASFRLLSEEEIFKMVFSFRTVKDSLDYWKSSKMLDYWKSSKMDRYIEPKFYYSAPKPTELLIKINNKAIIIQPYDNSIDQNEVNKLLSTLTPPQKQCLIFILCCCLAKRPCIIQGESGSGKSHVINVFAKIVGIADKLNVYQMNKETEYFLSNQNNRVVINELTQNEITDLLSCLKKLKKLKIAELQKETTENINSLTDSNQKPEEKSTFSSINNLLNHINQILQDRNLNQNILDKLEAIANEMDNIILPQAKRYFKEDSKFWKSIKNGDWVLIDGLESAPGQLPENLAFLTEKIIESELSDEQEKKQIHDNFFLLITYNPTLEKNKKYIHSLFSKCLTFALPPINSSTSFSQPVKTPKRVDESERIEKFNKFTSEEDSDKNIQFNGVNLRFTKYYLIYNKFHNLFYNYGFSSKSDKRVHDRSYNDNYSPKEAETNSGGKRKNKKVFQMLQDIQRFCKGQTKNSQFNFADFIQAVLSIEFQEIGLVQYHINGTYQMIKGSSLVMSNKVIRDNFSQILIVRNILEEIPKTNTTQLLSDVSSHDSKDYEKPLQKLHLLNDLFRNFSQLLNVYLNQDFLTEEASELIKNVSEFFKEGNFDTFSDLMETLNKNPKSFLLLEKIFPSDIYYKNSDTLIGYSWVSLFIKLYKLKIKFQVIVDDKEVFSFRPSESENEKNIDVELKFRRNLNFYLCEGSKVSVNEVKKFSILYEVDKFKLYSYFIYSFLFQLKKNSSDKEIEDSIFLVKETNKNKKNKKRKKKKKELTFPKPKKNFEIYDLVSGNKKYETPLPLVIFAVTFFQDISICQYCLDFLNPVQKGYFNELRLISEPNTLITFAKETLKYCEYNSFLSKISLGIDEMSKKYLTNEYVAKFYQNKIRAEILQLYQISQNLKESFKPIVNENIETLKKFFTTIYPQEEIKQDLTEPCCDAQKYLNKVVSNLKSVYLESLDFKYDQDPKNSDTQVCVLKTQKSNTLNWVSFESKGPKIENDNIKIMKILLRYSKMYSKLKKLMETKSLSCILGLDEFEEMKNVCKMLNSIFINKVSYLNEMEMNDNQTRIIFSMLNAHFLLQWEEKKINKNARKITDLNSFVNDYLNRKPIENEYEIEFITKEVLNYEDYFIIYLPEIKPIDFLYLFINHNDDNLTCVPGPLLENLESNKVIEDLQSLINKKLNFTNLMVEIVKIIYINIFNSKLSLENIEDIEKEIDNKIKHLETQKKPKEKPLIHLMNKIKSFISLANQLEEKKIKYEINYQDIEFLNAIDPFTDKNICSSYPSLIFFFVKYPKILEELKEKYRIFDPKEHTDCIPLWLFTLRIVSSLSCITFESELELSSQDYLKEIRKIIIDLLENFSYSLENAKWVNIALISVPEDIQEPKIKYLHDFFINICRDKKELLPIFQEEKKTTILVMIREIIKIIFENKLEEEIYGKTLHDEKDEDKQNLFSDDVITFIQNPEQFLRIRIGKKNFEESPSNLKEILKYYHSLCKDFKDKVSKFENIILKKETKLNCEIQQEEISKKRKLIEKEKQKTIELIRKYNILFNNLKGGDVETSSSIKDIKNAKEKILQSRYTSRKERTHRIISYKLSKSSCQSYCESEDYQKTSYVLEPPLESVNLRVIKDIEGCTDIELYNILVEGTVHNKFDTFFKSTLLYLFKRKQTKSDDDDYVNLTFVKFNFYFPFEREQSESGWFITKYKHNSLTVNNETFYFSLESFWKIERKTIQLNFTGNYSVKFNFKSNDYNVYLKLEDWEKLREIVIYYDSYRVLTLYLNKKEEFFSELSLSQYAFYFSESHFKYEKEDILFKPLAILSSFNDPLIFFSLDYMIESYLIYCMFGLDVSEITSFSEVMRSLNVTYSGRVLKAPEYFQKINSFLSDSELLLENNLEKKMVSKEELEKLKDIMNIGFGLLLLPKFNSPEKEMNFLVEISKEFKKIFTGLTQLMLYIQVFFSKLSGEISNIFNELAKQQLYFNKEFSLPLPNSKEKEEIESIPEIRKFNLNCLSTPFIRNTKTKIKFSSKDFNISIRTTCSSLYTKTIEILSLCTKPIYVSVDKPENEGEAFLVLTKTKYDPGEHILLQFKIPGYKNAKDFFEYNLTFSFDESHNYSEKIKLKIFTQILPISLILTSNKYPMKVNSNGKLVLSTDVFFSNAPVTFNIKNYYLNFRPSGLQYRVTVWSLEKNQAKKPEINICEWRETISVKMPKEKDKRIHFQMNVWFTNDFFVPIIFDGTIKDFDTEYKDDYDSLQNKHVDSCKHFLQNQPSSNDEISGYIYFIQEGKIPERVDKYFLQKKIAKIKTNTSKENEIFPPETFVYEGKKNLNKLISFYKETNNQIKLLPTLIKNSIVNNKEEDLKKAFISYLNILEPLAYLKRYSFLSESFNEIQDSLLSLTLKFEKLNLIPKRNEIDEAFFSILKAKRGLKEKQYFLRYLDKNEFKEDRDFWEINLEKSYSERKPKMEASLELMDALGKSIKLSSIFYKAAVNTQSSCKPFSATIFINGNGFFNEKRQTKELYMTIVCGLTSFLNQLRIPFSVSLIDKKESLIILKDYQTTHSLGVLQNVFESLETKGAPFELSTSFEYIIEKTSFNSEDSKKNRLIFVLSNSLVALDSLMKNIILNQPLNSFGFINLVESGKILCSNNSSPSNYSSCLFTKYDLYNSYNYDNIFDSLYQMMTNVMKKKSECNTTEEMNFKLPISMINNELKNISFIEEALKVDLSDTKEITVRKSKYFNDKLTSNSKENIIDTQFYNNIMGNISDFKSSPNLSQRILEITKLTQGKAYKKCSYLSSIFSSNELSSRIRCIDSSGLISNLINNGSSSLTYSENNFIPDITVTMIIDASFSCLNELSSPHTIQTIKEILSSLSLVELEYFDLIIAQEKSPIVICSGVGTAEGLQANSKVWESLFTTMSFPQRTVDLPSALKVACDLNKTRSPGKTSFLFVLTDGLFSEDEQKKISIQVNNCIKEEMNVFGIGVGFYPKGIPHIFPQYVYSQNPENVMKNIASFFED